MSSRLKALVIAELCNPEWVSGPLVGWNHAFALSKLVDVHLVTHVMNRPAIERSAWPKDRVTFIDLGNFDDLQRWMTEAFKIDRSSQMFTLLSIPFYFQFERLIWKAFGERIGRGEFDVVHRITPVSPVIASPLAERCARAGVPFVLGPINGGLPWPKGYVNALHKERQLVSHVRSLYRYTPYVPSTWRNASALLVASRTTWNEIPERHHARCYYLPENGITEASIAVQARRHPGEPLRAVFVGRLVGLKCVDVALRGAAPLVREGRLVVDVVGDGPERAYLEQVAAEEGIVDRTTFHGWLEHGDSMKVLGQGHVLLFPSIREFGGGVVMEAMAFGVVPIVVDYGGPGEIVDDTCGYKLPLASSEETAKQITSILRELLGSKDRFEQLSNGCRERVRSAYTWEAKARATQSVYRHAIGEVPRPALDLPAPA